MSAVKVRASYFNKPKFYILSRHFKCCSNEVLCNFGGRNFYLSSNFFSLNNRISFSSPPKPFLPHWALSVFCVIDMLFQAADKLVAISCLSCEGEVQKHNIFLTEHISLVCAICKNRQNATEALSCHGMTYQVTSTHTKILSKPLSALFKCPSLLGDKKVNCTAATYFSNSSKKAMQK